MRVYLAARYSRIDELAVYAGQLRGAGHEVTSRWLLGGHWVGDGGLGTAVVSAYALEDYFDLSAADTVVSFTEGPGTGVTRGGRHVEFGMAVALGKRLLVVGPRETIFHTLPQVQHFEDWGGALAALRAGSPRGACPHRAADMLNESCGLCHEARRDRVTGLRVGDGGRA